MKKGEWGIVVKSELIRLAKKSIVILVIALVLEIFFFNYRYWESKTYDKDLECDTIIGEGFTQVSDGVYQVADAENAYVELAGFEGDVKNIHLDMFKEYFIGEDALEVQEHVDGVAGDGYIDAENGTAITIEVNVTDEGHFNYHPMPLTEVIKGIEPSSYIRLYTDGLCRGVRVNIILENGDFVRISDIALNSSVPFNFRCIRFAVLIILELLILCFRPGSFVYREVLDLKKRRQLIIAVLFIALQLLVTFFAAVSAKPYDNWNGIGIHSKQYEELAKNIMDGHLEMTSEPPEFLQEMDNPYDYINRSIESIVNDEPVLPDFSYYKGHYYVYFGITPELLFFLPVELVTGKVLQTWIAVLFCALVYVLLSFRFVYVVAKRFFKETSFGIYLILSAVLAFGTGALYLTAFGTTYSMPAICGMMLVLAGITLWLKAGNEEHLCRLYLITGAVLLALTIGCRPQYAFMVFLAFPIFWNEIKVGQFFRLGKNSIINTLSVILPFLVYGIFILYYNYIRFDDPFEFGVTYLLTVNDMTNFNSSPAKLFEGLFIQLLQPLHIVSAYPFMKIIDSELTLQADQYMEPMLGGLLALSPILVFAFGIFGKNLKSGTEKKETSIISVGIVSFILGAIIIVLDILSAGTSQRYQADFAIYLMMPALIVILDLAERFGLQSAIPLSKEIAYSEDIEEQKESVSAEELQKSKCDAYRLFVLAILILAVFTLGNNLLTIIADGKYFAMDDMNPETYYYIKYVFFRI